VEVLDGGDRVKESLLGGEVVPAPQVAVGVEGLDEASLRLDLRPGRAVVVVAPGVASRLSVPIKVHVTLPTK